VNFPSSLGSRDPSLSSYGERRAGQCVILSERIETHAKVIILLELCCTYYVFIHSNILVHFLVVECVVVGFPHYFTEFWKEIFILTSVYEHKTFHFPMFVTLLYKVPCKNSHKRFITSEIHWKIKRDELQSIDNIFLSALYCISQIEKNKCIVTPSPYEMSLWGCWDSSLCGSLPASSIVVDSILKALQLFSLRQKWKCSSLSYKHCVPNNSVRWDFSLVDAFFFLVTLSQVLETGGSRALTLSGWGPPDCPSGLKLLLITRGNMGRQGGKKEVRRR
jgi:hypothetical protein